MFNEERFSTTQCRLWHKIDEGIENTIYDSSGYSNNGSLGGGTEIKKPTWSKDNFPIIIQEEVPVFTGYILNTPSSIGTASISGCEALGILSKRRVLIEEEISGEVSDNVRRILRAYEKALKTIPKFADSGSWTLEGGATIDSDGGIRLPMTNVSAGLRAARYK